jgi:thiamine transport system permease protein
MPRARLSAIALQIALLALPCAFLLIAFVYPLALLFARAFDAPQAWANAVAELTQDDYFARVIGFSIGQAALSTGVTLALAVPSGVAFARYRFPFKRVLAALALLPFLMPTVVVAAAFNAWLGERGLINTALMAWLRLDVAPLQLGQTFALIVLAHVFYNFAIAQRMIAAFWRGAGVRAEEAARAHGASAWRMWTRVLLPLLWPVLLGAGLLVFVFNFTSFGVILILGGPRFTTLEVEIYRQAIQFFDLPLAALLSLLQLALMLSLVLLHHLLTRRHTILNSTPRAPQPPRSWRARAFVAANAALIVVLVALPLGALVWRSLLAGDGTLTWAHYARLATLDARSVLPVPPLHALGTSLVYALGVAVLAALLGVMIAAVGAQRSTRGARRIGTFVDVLLMLPLATSAVTLGFGYLLTFTRPPLAGSALLVVALHTLIGLPFVVRALLPALAAQPRHLAEAAALCGAGAWRRAWTLHLPLSARALAAGAAFAFCISIGEFGASSFILRTDAPTVTTVIFRLLGQPGAANYGQALALCVVVLMLCAVCFALIDFLTEGDLSVI